MSDQTIRKPLTAGAKLFLVIAIVLCLVNLADFAFNRHQWTDLIIAVGFALMAYGTYKNGNRNRPDGEHDRTFNKNAQVATGIGVALALGALGLQLLH